MELRLTAKVVADRIVQARPEWVVESIGLLGEGEFSTAYLVNDSWVFRFAKHAEAAESLLREACLLPRIEDRFEFAIPSPQVVNTDGQVFVGHPFLRGPALTRDRYVRLTEDARDRCTRSVAQFLLQMHAVPLTLARDCGVEDVDYRREYAEVRARAQQVLAGELGPAEHAFVEKALVPHADESTFDPVLLHGDLSPDHVLYDVQTAATTAILDFGDVEIGDPAWDFVYLYEDYGLDFLDRALRGTFERLGA